MSKSGYDFYLKEMLLPVPPSQLKVSINDGNSQHIMISEGQINLLKRAKLTDIEFECDFPQVRYPYARYVEGFKPAKYYLDYLEKLKTDRKPFQFIVSRVMPTGKVLFNTNIKVALQDYTLTEKAVNGFDVTVKVKLKQYRDYATKTVEIKQEKPKDPPKAEVKKTRPPSTTNNAPSSGLPTTYTVKTGDCCWTIAKHFYGDPTKYPLIEKANGFKQPYYIYTGDKITIPADK